jgi:hypothetical protein
MNPYTTKTCARILPRDVASVLRTNSYLAGSSLAALERTRGWQAEAEVAWLLEQHGVPPESASSRIAMLRNAIGAALVRAGQRLAAAPQRGAASPTVPSADTLPTAG